MKLKISVILPIHNAEKELVSLVHDCFETTNDVGAESEIIIIDDASTDASGDIAEKLSLEYPQIQVISQWRHRGMEKSILIGLNHARGDLLYVYYMMSGHPFPQMALFYEAMPFADVVLGRFLGPKDSFIGIAMLKKQAFTYLGDAVACPEDTISVMEQNNIRYLELRYETRNSRNESDGNRVITKPGHFKRISQTVGSTL